MTEEEARPNAPAGTTAGEEPGTDATEAKPTAHDLTELLDADHAKALALLGVINRLAVLGHDNFVVPGKEETDRAAHRMLDRKGGIRELRAWLRVLWRPNHSPKAMKTFENLVEAMLAASFGVAAKDKLVGPAAPGRLETTLNDWSRPTAGSKSAKNKGKAPAGLQADAAKELLVLLAETKVAKGHWSDEVTLENLAGLIPAKGSATLSERTWPLVAPDTLRAHSRFALSHVHRQRARLEEVERQMKDLSAAMRDLSKELARERSQRTAAEQELEEARKSHESKVIQGNVEQLTHMDEMSAMRAGVRRQVKSLSGRLAQLQEILEDEPPPIELARIVLPWMADDLGTIEKILAKEEHHGHPGH